MAASNDAESYGKTVELNYRAGLLLRVALDPTTMTQLLSPGTREELLNTIRQNSNIAGVEENPKGRTNTGANTHVTCTQPVDNPTEDAASDLSHTEDRNVLIELEEATKVDRAEREAKREQRENERNGIMVARLLKNRIECFAEYL